MCSLAPYIGSILHKTYDQKVLEWMVLAVAYIVNIPQVTQLYTEK